MELERTKYPQKKYFIRQEKIGPETFDQIYTYNKKTEKWEVKYKNVMTVGGMSVGEVFKKAASIEKELAKTVGSQIAEEVAS